MRVKLFHLDFCRQLLFKEDTKSPMVQKFMHAGPETRTWVHMVFGDPKKHE